MKNLPNLEKSKRKSIQKTEVKGTKNEKKAQRISSHLIARGRIDGQVNLVRQLVLWLHYLGKKSPRCPHCRKGGTPVIAERMTSNKESHIGEKGN